MGKYFFFGNMDGQETSKLEYDGTLPFFKTPYYDENLGAFIDSASTKRRLMKEQGLVEVVKGEMSSEARKCKKERVAERERMNRVWNEGMKHLSSTKNPQSQREIIDHIHRGICG